MICPAAVVLSGVTGGALLIEDEGGKAGFECCIVGEPSGNFPAESRVTGVPGIDSRTSPWVTDSPSVRTTLGEGNAGMICPSTVVVSGAAVGAPSVVGDTDGNFEGDIACVLPSTIMLAAAGSIDIFWPWIWAADAAASMVDPATTSELGSITTT
jgi:hypothetical protein